MFRVTFSGLCVAQVFGTGEHGALMQSQANTEDLDAILLANTDSSDKPRLSKHHFAHSSHERSRAKLTELQSSAHMLEQKYKAILHAKVETAGAATASNVVHATNGVTKRGADEWVPAADLFDPVDLALNTMEETLKSENTLNQDLINKAKDVLEECNMVRRDEFDLPRYMDYYYYAKTIDHICINFNECWNAAERDWDALRANTEILEESQKLIWRVMEKARCYVQQIKKNQPTRQDIEQCVSLDIDTSPLNIVYDPEIVKDVCDICSVQTVPVSDNFDDTIDTDGHAGSGGINTERGRTWAARHHRKPEEGIVNAAKVMFEMLEKKGLMDQHVVEQEEVYRANREVAACNTVKRATWIAENTDQLGQDMRDARDTHSGCRSHEIRELTIMQEQCIVFKNQRVSCNANKAKAHQGSWAYWFDDHDGNASLSSTIEEGKKCWAQINRTNPISANCDDKQDLFEDEFCEYFASKNKTCWDHTICYDRETAERTSEVDYVKKREHSLILQHRMLKINQCFIDLMQGATDADTAQELETSHMEQCANVEYDVSHLIILYPEAEVKDACPLDDIEFYPGQVEWETGEFSASPFSDQWNSMKEIDSCSFHSVGLVQKMKGRSRSMRSP